MVGAELACTASAFSALRTVVNTVAPNALASWIAVVPMPLAPPWISTALAGLELAALEEVVPDGEVVLRQRRGAAACRSPWAAAGIAAPARCNIRRRSRRASARTRASPTFHPRDAVAQRGDRAGGLEAGQVRGARRRRIGAGALGDVGPVDAGRGDLDQDLAGLGLAAPAASSAPALRARRAS